MKIGDTIRVICDEPSLADLKEGSLGVITSITTSGGVYARFGAKTWSLAPDDFEVVAVGDTFAAMVKGLDLVDPELLRAAYDEAGFAPLPAVPVEIASDPAVLEAEPTESSDDDHDDCPKEEPHYHGDDGEAVVLPHLSLTDYAGDILLAVDVREITSDMAANVALTVMAGRPGMGAVEIHLSDGQAVALLAFLLKRFRS